MCPSEAPSRLDQIIISGVRSRYSACLRRLPRLRQGSQRQMAMKFDSIVQKPRAPATIKGCMQTLGGQQLATGITLLVVSYVQHCELTRYHFTFIIGICTYAWAVQIIVAEFETYFSRNRSSQNILKIIATFCFWGLSVPTGIPFYNDGAWDHRGEELPVKCLWNTWTRITRFRRAWALALWQVYMLWSLLFISSKHSTMLRCCVGALEDWIQSWIRTLSCKLLWSREPSPRKSLFRYYHVVLERLLSFIHGLTISAWLCLQARASRLFLTTTTLTLLTAIFSRYKAVAADLVKATLDLPEDQLSDEGDWGSIGQILPLVLLVLPIVSVTQGFEGKLPRATPISYPLTNCPFLQRLRMSAEGRSLLLIAMARTLPCHSRGPHIMQPYLGCRTAWLLLFLPRNPNLQANKCSIL
jgi:hypothetical protein